MLRSLFPVLMAGVVSCSQTVPPPAEPILVRAPDLARAYRVDRLTADMAYSGLPVTVAIASGVVRGNEIHWHLSDSHVPAVLVFRFAKPPEFTGPCWITGVCGSAVRDGNDREFSGYDFSVTITDCQIVPPPAKPAP